jgi:hypothetical protein
MTDPIDFAIAAALIALIAIAWPSIAQVVEEWSYAKKQPAPDHAADAGNPDAVGADVVRTRPRRVSISPWIK